MKNNRFVLFIKKTLQIFKDNDMNVYSGYATLYILMSLIPLLMLVISIINLLPSYSAQDFSDFIMKFIPDLPQVQDMLTGIIKNLNNQSSGTVASISALTTLWSASNGVSSIQTGLEQINGEKRSAIKGKLIALLFTVVLVLLIPSLLVFQLLRQPVIDAVILMLNWMKLETVIPMFETIMSYSGVIVIVVTVAVLVLLYTYLPCGERTIKSQLPGAVFTLVLCGIFTAAFGFFMGRFWKASSVYGSLAAIFLCAMWMKFLITILFYGAAMNKAKEND